MKITPFLYLIVSFSLTSYSQTVKIENLKFKNFDVEIINFVSASPPSSQNNSAMPDTLEICENPCDDQGWYIDGKTLKIVPKFKGDSFTLAYAYQVDIFEVSGKWEEEWTYYTWYIAIPSWKKNQFKIEPNENTGYIKSIKKKYNFRDTSVTTNSESGPHHYRFTRDGKIFSDAWNHLYLRIKRFNKGKFIESNYIVIGLSEGCD
jgi:hypothetical protein